MIIDAKKDKCDYFRPHTVIGAIASKLVEMRIDDFFYIEKVLDFEGNEVPLKNIRMFINSIGKTLELKFVTRNKKDKLFVCRIS